MGAKTATPSSAEDDTHRRIWLARTALAQFYLDVFTSAPGDGIEHLSAAVVEQQELLANGEMQDISDLVGKLFGKLDGCTTQQFGGNEKTMHGYYSRLRQTSASQSSIITCSICSRPAAWRGPSAS